MPKCIKRLVDADVASCVALTWETVVGKGFNLDAYERLAVFPSVSPEMSPDECELAIRSVADAVARSDTPCALLLPSPDVCLTSLKGLAGGNAERFVWDEIQRLLRAFIPTYEIADGQVDRDVAVETRPAVTVYGAAKAYHAVPYSGDARKSRNLTEYLRRHPSHHVADMLLGSSAHILAGVKAFPACRGTVIAVGRLVIMPVDADKFCDDDAKLIGAVLDSLVVGEPAPRGQAGAVGQGSGQKRTRGTSRGPTRKKKRKTVKAKTKVKELPNRTWKAVLAAKIPDDRDFTARHVEKTFGVPRTTFQKIESQLLLKREKRYGAYHYLFGDLKPYLKRWYESPLRRSRPSA